MKNIIILLVMQLLMFNSILAQEIDTYEIQVDGLGCPFCAYGLEKKFKEFKEISKVAIDIESGEFQFQYPSTKPLSMNQVVTQVKKAGYTPREVKIFRVDGKVVSFVANAKEKNSDVALSKTELKVSGNCEMCKSRIESAALSIAGVQKANWDKSSKLLTIEAQVKTLKEEVSSAIALEGHDTELRKSLDQAYANLPACCLYRPQNN